MRFLITMIVLFSSVFCNVVQADQDKSIKLYMAAGLFSARETRFNLEITRLLESKGYQAILPQRDGFEFANLRNSMAGLQKPEKIIESTRNLIYLLDMGVFIPHSDAVIANLDEPVDDGVIVELTYAHLMGKPVIGVRTDLRTPFGSYEGLGGLHSFVAYQCDEIIIEHLPATDPLAAEKALQQLADKLDILIQSRVKQTKELPDYVMQNPSMRQLVTVANRVIGDPNVIHTQTGLDKVIKRLARYQKDVRKIQVAIV